MYIYIYVHSKYISKTRNVPMCSKGDRVNQAASHWMFLKNVCVHSIVRMAQALSHMRLHQLKCGVKV